MSVDCRPRNARPTFARKGSLLQCTSHNTMRGGNGQHRRYPARRNRSSVSSRNSEGDRIDEEGDQSAPSCHSDSEEPRGETRTTALRADPDDEPLSARILSGSRQRFGNEKDPLCSEGASFAPDALGTFGWRLRQTGGRQRQLRLCMGVRNDDSTPAAACKNSRTAHTREAGGGEEVASRAHA